MLYLIRPASMARCAGIIMMNACLFRHLSRNLVFALRVLIRLTPSDERQLHIAAVCPNVGNLIFEL